MVMKCIPNRLVKFYLMFLQKLILFLKKALLIMKLVILQQM